MAYIIGLLNDAERAALEQAGWEFEPADQMIDEIQTMDKEKGESMQLIGVFVDTSVHDVMTGPDWEPAPQ